MILRLGGVFVFMLALMIQFEKIGGSPYKTGTMFGVRIKFSLVISMTLFLMTKSGKEL